jgi:hypothetical protein
MDSVTFAIDCSISAWFAAISFCCVSSSPIKASVAGSAAVVF